MEYLPFGELLEDEHLNSYNTPYKFNAKELDEETGNYYYGARYYNPKWSTWLSVDPLAEQMPSWSSYNYAFSNPVVYTDPTGMAPVIERPNSYKGKLKKGDWREDDRINETEVWKNANKYNLQQEKGFEEYKTIEQRADFYKWFQHESDSKGHETNWAGAAYVVAKQMANIHGPFTFMIDNSVESDIKKFAEAGNKAIFENVFSRLKGLLNGDVKTGKNASSWDNETLSIEQRDIVGPIYQKQNDQVLNELSRMAKGQGMYKLGVPPSLRFNQNGNIRDWKQRFKHGMTVSLPFWNKYFSKRNKK